MSHFLHSFSGKVKLNDYEVELHDDLDILTIAAPKKNEPFHLQGRLDKKIEKIEDNGNRRPKWSSSVDLKYNLGTKI